MEAIHHRKLKTAILLDRDLLEEIDSHNIAPSDITAHRPLKNTLQSFAVLPLHDYYGTVHWYRCQGKNKFDGTAVDFRRQEG